MKQRLLEERKSKLFRIVLSFSIHSPDPFFSSAHFHTFNLSYTFLSFHPQCYFSFNVLSSNLSEELSIISHTFTLVFLFCYSFKHFYEKCFREAMVPITVTEGMTEKTYVFEGFTEAV